MEYKANKKISLKDIEDAINQTGLQDNIDAINKAINRDYENLMKDFKHIKVIDENKLEYYSPNGVKITSNKENI